LTSSLSGRVVSWLGRRKTVVYNQVLSGVVILVITLVPSVYLSMFSRLVASLFVSLLYSAQSGIVLEQVPDYRGTVMSLNQAAGLLGGTIGGISGGLVLARYGYNFLGPILGVIMGCSAYIFSKYVSEKPVSASNR